MSPTILGRDAWCREPRAGANRRSTATQGRRPRCCRWSVLEAPQLLQAPSSQTGPSFPALMLQGSCADGAAAPAVAPETVAVLEPDGDAASFIRFTEPSGSSHVTSLTPVSDTRSTCACRFDQSTAVPVTVKFGTVIQVSAAGSLLRPFRPDFEIAQGHCRDVELQIGAAAGCGAVLERELVGRRQIDAAGVDDEIELILQVLPQRVRQQAVDLEFTVGLHRLHREMAMPLDAFAQLRGTGEGKFAALDSRGELAQFEN